MSAFIKCLDPKSLLVGAVLGAVSTFALSFFCPKFKRGKINLGGNNYLLVPVSADSSEAKDKCE
jgi:hypothetical protein